MAALECGQFGKFSFQAITFDLHTHVPIALAFASGSATTATLVNMLPTGSHIISVNDVYGGTYRYFTKGRDLSYFPLNPLSIF